ncbi:phosphodiester glycosidase family protein [Streptomyces sp. NPDC012888]|uniref:phosphodiester glycosidase family protein n=1 Tax=Streptomyces sp. NPDC012888 TaxID=3364855 RepID=UPI00369299A9
MSTLRPLLGTTLLPLLLLAPATAHAADGIETDRTSRPLAPGVRLESYDRLEADRWLRVDELRVDLAAAGVAVEYLGGPATVAEAAARHRAATGRRVLAAVNGDFFDIRRTGAPLGPGLAAGRLLHAPARGAGAAVGFGPGGRGRVLRLALEGEVTLPGGAVRPLTGFNSARPPARGIAAYTADWTGALLPAGSRAEADVRDGRVTAVRSGPDGGTPPRGVTRLTARDAAAAADLEALRPGDRVRVAAGLAAADARPVPRSAIGGREPLVVAGKPRDHDRVRNNHPAPRTAVGFSGDGRSLRILTVDGRQRDSGGLTLTALGRLLRDLGAHDALNLDGGGSTTLLATRPGEDALVLENSPSDGSPRRVPNGLALTVPAGSGRATGFLVEAVAGTTRVFPGLSRTLTATGHDETFGPAPVAGPEWWTTPGSAGRVGPDGVFRADRTGAALVHAGRTPADGGIRLSVLRPLTRVEPSADRLAFAGPADETTLRLTGYDADGAAAPVEPRDVRWQYDPARWRVVDDGRGGFTVTALAAHGSGLLRATVPATGATTWVRVGVGLADTAVEDWDVEPGWSGPGTKTAAGHTGTGIRVAGGESEARPPRPLPLPGSVRRLHLWARADGPAPAAPLLHLTDRHGAELTLRGPAVEPGTGWTRTEVPVPAGAAGPLTLEGLGSTTPLVVDTLTAESAPGPAVPLGPPGAPPARPYRDRLLTGPAQIRARPWRFAILPAGRTPAEVRQALARARAEHVDFVLGGPAGTAAAPGRTALTGPDRPGAFRPVPGGGAFRHRGVRFLRLDTTRPTLAGGGLTRLRALRAELAAAARDPGTGALAVVQDHAGPELVDRKETAARTRLLEEFRRTTGKGAAVITLDAPRSAAGRTEGVLSYAAAPTRWALVGADAFAGRGARPAGADAGTDWLAVHERPLSAARESAAAGGVAGPTPGETRGAVRGAVRGAAPGASAERDEPAVTAVRR